LIQARRQIASRSFLPDEKSGQAAVAMTDHKINSITSLRGGTTKQSADNQQNIHQCGYSNIRNLQRRTMPIMTDDIYLSLIEVKTC
jgi:hypothetical protein